MRFKRMVSHQYSDEVWRYRGETAEGCAYHNLAKTRAHLLGNNEVTLLMLLQFPSNVILPNFDWD